MIAYCTSTQHARQRRTATAFWSCVMTAAAMLLGEGASAFDWSGTDFSGAPCEIVQGQTSYGPFDYTNPEHFRDKLPIVTGAHFTRDVENLVRGKSGSIQEDIYYTLRSFPNHHRALHSLVRYQLNNESARPKLQIAPECFLDRAIAFKPTDRNVYMIYGIYLHARGKLDDAEQKYKLAEALSDPSTSAELFYNLGLLYVEMGDYESARRYARMAYEGKYPLPGLRNLLARNGHPL